LIGLFLHNIGGSPHFWPFVGKGAIRALHKKKSALPKQVAEEQY